MTPSSTAAVHPACNVALLHSYLGYHPSQIKGVFSQGDIGGSEDEMRETWQKRSG